MLLDGLLSAMCGDLSILNVGDATHLITCMTKGVVMNRRHRACHPYFVQIKIPHPMTKSWRTNSDTLELR